MNNIYTLKTIPQRKAISLFLSIILITLALVVGAAAIGVGTVQAAQVTIDFENVPLPPQSAADYNGSQEDGFNISTAGSPNQLRINNIFIPAPLSGNAIFTQSPSDIGKLTITKQDATSFQFIGMDVDAGGSGLGSPYITVQGYVGGTSGTLAGADRFNLPNGISKSVTAVHLTGKTGDTLVINLYGDPTYNGTSGLDNIVWEADPPPMSKMSVSGNSQDIVNGDSTPSVADNTEFGSAVSADGNVTHSFNIYNSGSADLELAGTPSVSLSGPGATQFTITAQPGSPIGAQVESHFTLAFTPAAGGQSATATVTITSNDTSRSPYTFVIEGQGGIHV